MGGLPKGDATAFRFLVRRKFSLGDADDLDLARREIFARIWTREKSK